MLIIAHARMHPFRVCTCTDAHTHRQPPTLHTHIHTATAAVRVCTRVCMCMYAGMHVRTTCVCTCVCTCLCVYACVWHMSAYIVGMQASGYESKHTRISAGVRACMYARAESVHVRMHTHTATQAAVGRNRRYAARPSACCDMCDTISAHACEALRRPVFR